MWGFGFILRRFFIVSSNESFNGVRLKLERAEHHIHKLELIFNQWTKANIKALRATKHKGRRTIGKPLPRHTPTVLGDALHNLRASLDHAYCVLTEANGGQVTRHTKFPFHSNRTDCAASINGLKPETSPSRVVLDFILDTIQPYQGGDGADLYGLHNLDIADKHTNLIAADYTFKNTEFKYGNLTFIGGTFVSIGGKAEGIFEFPTGENFQYHGNPETAFKITIQEGQPFEGRDILDTLKALQISVTNCIEALERFS